MPWSNYMKKNELSHEKICLLKCAPLQNLNWLYKSGSVGIPRLIFTFGITMFCHDTAHILRNKVHFSEVHRSMNAMGHVQSKRRPKSFTGITLTLHVTHRVHTSINLRKNEIHLLYLLFVFMPPLRRSWRGILVSGCPSVHTCVRLSVHLFVKNRAC